MSTGTPDRAYAGAAITRDGARIAYTYGADVFTRELATGAERQSLIPFIPAVAPSS